MARLQAVPTHPTLASLDVVEEIAHGLEDGALHCRESRRHDWRPSRVTKERYGYRRVQVCTDCGSSQWQELDARGYVIRKGTEYVDGYLLPKGTGRVNADGLAVYRLEALTRYLPKGRRKRAVS